MQTKFDTLIQPFMRQRNGRWLFFILPGLLLLLIAWNPIPAFSQSDAGIVRTPWEMNRGGDIIDLGTVLPSHGHPTLYTYMNIPAVNDAGWGAPPLDADGNIFLSETSALVGRTCLAWADFTYFQTLVTIPDGFSVSQFEVRFQQVDDGARVYVFNSAHPTGAFIEGGDITLDGPPTTTDLSSLIVVGETNRVVIVQVDDCPDENNLRNAQLFVNGSMTAEDPDAEGATAFERDISNATSVAWSADRSLVATGSAEGTVQVWDVATEASVITLDEQSGPVNSLAWSPNGSRLAAGVEDGTVIVWEAAEWAIFTTFEDAPGSVTSVVWSPDGARLAAAATGSVVVWDVETAEVVATLVPATAGDVTSVVWSPRRQPNRRGHARQRRRLGCGERRGGRHARDSDGE